MKSESILDLFRYYTGEHNHYRYNELNQAYRIILKRTNLWNQKISKINLISLVAGVFQYQVDFGDFRSASPDRVFIKKGNSQVWTEIDEAQEQQFETSRPSNSEDEVSTSHYAEPLYFRLSGDDSYNFSINPVPDKAYDIRFDGIAKIVELDRGVTPIIADNYHETIGILASSIFLKQKKDATQQELNQSLALKQEAEAELESLYRDNNANRMNNLGWKPRRMMY